jgi:alpha-1,3-glucosyltransferase
VFVLILLSARCSSSPVTFSRPLTPSQVLARLAPFHRGLYEDYVANFWCTSSRVIKWQRLFSQEQLMRLCLGATVAAALPSMYMQIRRPSRRGLLYTLACSAFAFFLFSYQVHEKSVLLPLLPVALLALEEPLLALAFPLIAMLSMYPLLEKDRLTLPYLALSGLYLCGVGSLDGVIITDKKRGRSLWRRVYLGALLATMAALHLARAYIPPPPSLPFLHDALFT